MSSGEIVPVDKVSRYPGRRATATKPATVEVKSWTTLNMSSLALRWTLNHFRPSDVRMILSNLTISDQIVGGFSSSTVTIVFMRQ